MSQPHSEMIAMMVMRPAMTYTPYTIYLREQTGNIITFSQFEEGDLFSESRDYAESGNKSNGDSTMPPLIIKVKWMRWI